MQSTSPPAPAPAMAAAYPAPGRAWWLVATLVIATVISYTDRQILSLVVDPIRADLGISDTQVGLLMGSAFAFVYGIAGIPLGWLADRVCRRNLIVAGITLWSLGTVCCGLAHDFTQFFSARILVGIGEAVLTPASVSMISDSFRAATRGRATSVFLMGIAMGAGGAIMIGGLILRLVQDGVLPELAGITTAWRLVLLLLGLTGLLPAVLVALLREPARNHDSPGSKQHIGSNASALPNTTAAPATPGSESGVDWLRLAPLLLAMGVTSLVDNAVLAWTPSLLVRGFGLAPSHVGTMLGTLLMVSGGGGMLLGGFLSDRALARRHGAGRIAVTTVAAMLVLPTTLVLRSADLQWVLVAVTLYVGLSCVVASSGTLTLLGSAANRHHGLLTAVSFFLNVALGAGVGPVAVGIAADHLATSPLELGSAITLVACPGYMLVCALILVARRNSLQRQEAAR